MEIVDSNFNIFFPPIMNIRESIFNLENELSSFFPKPFNLIPIPNEAPLEIPRISATSHHGFSNLNISLNSAQFSTNFNENFSKDWKKCIDYIFQHISKIYAILKPRFNGKPSYCGLTINFIQTVDSGSAVELISSNFVRNNSSISPYDLLSKHTYVVENNYYINIQIQNQRLVKNQIIPIGYLGEFEKSNLLGISLDVNDRYGLNYFPSYSSGDDKIERVFSITDEIVSNKLERFILEGEFSL